MAAADLVMKLPWGHLRFSERTHLPVDKDAAEIIPKLIVVATDWQKRCVDEARLAPKEFTKYLDKRDALRAQVLKIQIQFKT